MNQILMIENKKKKNKKERRNSSPIEIANIVKIFSISIILFGVFLIGQGSYAIYKESKIKDTKDMPIVSVTRVNDTAVVKVMSNIKITYLKYSWDNAEQTVIPIEGNNVEEEILLPNENSKLNITIEDEKQRAIKYSKEFILDGIDITKPSIEIIGENQANVKVVATDETQISYITYKINDSEEVKIEKSASEDKTINYILNLNRGENNVIITAVDTSNNTETLEKKIIVSSAPTMELVQDKDTLWVNIKDEDGIKDIEVNLNGVISVAKDVKQKQVQVPLKLIQGTNSIKIKITNVNNLTAEGTKELNYAP